MAPYTPDICTALSELIPTIKSKFWFNVCFNILIVPNIFVFIDSVAFPDWLPLAKAAKWKIPSTLFKL